MLPPKVILKYSNAIKQAGKFKSREMEDEGRTFVISDCRIPFATEKLNPELTWTFELKKVVDGNIHRSLAVHC